MVPCLEPPVVAGGARAEKIERVGEEMDVDFDTPAQKLTAEIATFFEDYEVEGAEPDTPVWPFTVINAGTVLELTVYDGEVRRQFTVTVEER